VIDAYFTALAVPATTMALTDRLALRVFVTTSGRTLNLHTEDSHLSQVITTLSTGINAINGLTSQVQNLATGTAGSDFAISSTGSTHTFNLPTASAANRGALSSADWSTFNGKQNSTILYQFANGDTLASGATRFGSLFGGSANHNASDAVRRTPMITNGTLTRLYVMTSTAQPASGSLVCTVRKNSVDQALTITIAAGSAAGVFSDLVNSVSVLVGDQMGMKFVNNASGTSAAILNNQVLLTI
jgi:ABC-type phosphate/phosphonate transport system substrate-binding protein